MSEPDHTRGTRGTLGCEAKGSELSAYLDGELSPQEREAMQAHLAACDACRGGLRASQSLDARIRALPGVAATPALAERLHAALETHAPAHSGAPRAGGPRPVAPLRPASPRSRLLLHVAPWLAAACLLVALADRRSHDPLLPANEDDWSLIADADPAQFELMLSEDHDLLYALDLLESWEEEDRS